MVFVFMFDSCNVEIFGCLLVYFDCMRNIMDAWNGTSKYKLDHLKNFGFSKYCFFEILVIWRTSVFHGDLL